jgi:hypothetical protein
VRSYNGNYISMRYSETRISIRSSSFFYTLAFLVLVAVLSTISPTMSQVALAADASITKIQLPGIFLITTITILLLISLTLLMSPVITIVLSSDNT